MRIAVCTLCLLGFILVSLVGGCSSAEEPKPPDPDSAKKEYEQLKEARKKEWGK